MKKVASGVEVGIDSIICDEQITLVEVLDSFVREASVRIEEVLLKECHFFVFHDVHLASYLCHNRAQ
ncbi:MAG TPA: hypothetical protein PKN33_20210 [Phycisphaerae bacterium]|nr:hypothetical protein [Phycisphaerae bacterium]